MARINPAWLTGIALVATPATAQQVTPADQQTTSPAAQEGAPAQETKPDSGGQTNAAPPRGRPAGPVYGDDNPNRRPFNAGSDTKGDTNQPSPGPLATIGKRLADEGIKFRALETNEYANVLRGGASQGDANVGQFYLGADLDFDKLVGWHGAKLHVTGYRDYGTSANKHISGTLFKQQDIYKNEFPQLHFGLFALEQTLFHDRLDVIVGRLGTTAFYGHLQSNCFFQNGSTCGVPTVLNSESGFGLLPSATWGGNVKYSFSKTIYAQAGAFEVNPTIQDSNGFHHWSTKGATGFTVPFEVGYQDTNYRTTLHPTEVKAGFYASTGARNDVFFNARGQSAGLTGTTARPATSLRSGVYLMAERAIWRPDPRTSQSLTLFGGVVQPLERDEVVDREVYGGLILRQPFKSRPRDTIAFDAAWLHLSPGEQGFLRDSRIRAGGPSIYENPNEVNFEIDYGVGIGRAIRLTPNIQYTVNPESSQLPKISFVPKNMVTFGLKFTLDLASFLGFPGQQAGGD